MEKELLQLEKDIQELEAWKNSYVKEPLKFPLDLESKKILEKRTLIFTGRKITNVNGVILNDFIAIGLGIKINNKLRFALAIKPLLPFSAAVSDVITNTNGSHNLQNGDRIVLATTNTLPAGLGDTIIYYIINRTGTTFKVSLTLGGSAVDITDTGIGTHYYTNIISI